MILRKYFNQQLYDSLAGRIGEGFDEDTGRRVTNTVHSSIYYSLFVGYDGLQKSKRGRKRKQEEIDREDNRKDDRKDDKDIGPRAQMVSGLGADLSSGEGIAWRIERRLGIAFPYESEQLGKRILYCNGIISRPTEKTPLDIAEEAYRLVVGR
jgi:hypothetical protein